jgi:hypothetical protein
MAENPLNLIHNGAWAAAEADTELSTLVLPGNRIKLAERAELKKNIQDADLPELIFIPRSGIGNFTATSSNVGFEMTFDWLLSTGDLRVNYRLYPVFWSLYRSMAAFQATAGSLQYKDKKFVTGVFFQNASIGESDPERNRGVSGFSSVFSLMIRMSFPKGGL